MKTEVLRPARPWWALCLFAITGACLSPVVGMAAPASIEGEYQCDDCHGYLKIHKRRPGVYKVWLGPPMAMKKNAMLSISKPLGCRIECIEGSLWITQDGDPRDNLLCAGGHPVAERRRA